MKLGHVEKEDPYKHLTPLQKGCMIAAMVVAFCSIFVWFFKILLF